MNKKSQVKKHIHRFLLNTFCLEKLNIKKLQYVVIKIKTVKIDTCNQNTLFGEVILENKRSEFAA